MLVVEETADKCLLVSIQAFHPKWTKTQNPKWRVVRGGSDVTVRPANVHQVNKLQRLRLDVQINVAAGGSSVYYERFQQVIK